MQPPIVRKPRNAHFGFFLTEVWWCPIDNEPCMLQMHSKYDLRMYGASLLSSVNHRLHSILCLWCQVQLLDTVALPPHAECGVATQADAQGPEDKITFCQECGNNVHVECFKRWTASKKSSGYPVTCVYCRCPWVSETGVFITCLFVL